MKTSIIPSKFLQQIVDNQANGEDGESVFTVIWHLEWDGQGVYVASNGHVLLLEWPDDPTPPEHPQAYLPRSGVFVDPRTSLRNPSELLVSQWMAHVFSFESRDSLLLEKKTWAQFGTTVSEEEALDLRSFPGQIPDNDVPAVRKQYVAMGVKSPEFKGEKHFRIWYGTNATPIYITLDREDAMPVAIIMPLIRKGSRKRKTLTTG